ncbi:tetratricopeptide repeat protein [Pseudalkalibacillus caeni]|uniref:Tetratricopeptide repeat protein n=1 Tax=Exobacillus caeni TaxID=2574798 RepID=A0A5R9EY72_9BACL|nr:tetratricopeptide repeat protein [Pseudalkalibacillus caeni]TLS36067.1 tetratricopeptide repeat protein [Pseudalkalibacillus caeni]
MSELQKAIELRYGGKYDQAKEILLKLTQAEPENATALYQCACVHDNLGLEREAVPFYTAALQKDLTTEERKGALLGLGSTYRTIGDYEKAKATLEEGLDLYPVAQEFHVFYSMVLHNLGEHSKAMEILLKKIVELSDEPGIEHYKRAILFYSDKIDQIW